MSERESSAALPPAWRLLVLAIILAGGLSPVRAQAGKDHSVVGVHFYVPLDYYRIDAGDLNKYMGVAELPQVRIPGLFAGVGTQLQVDRVVLNVSASRASRRYDIDNASLRAPFSTYGFSLGYDLIECPFMNLQPYGGYRVTKMAYRYELNSDAAQPPGTRTEMDFRGRRGMFDLGIAASIQSGVLAGLHAGVLLPAGRPRWSSNDGSELTGGPDLRFRYYVGINIGFGRANIRLKNTPAAEAATDALTPSTPAGN